MRILLSHRLVPCWQRTMLGCSHSLAKAEQFLFYVSWKAFFKVFEGGMRVHWLY